MCHWSIACASFRSILSPPGAVMGHGCSEVLKLSYTVLVSSYPRRKQLVALHLTLTLRHRARAQNLTNLLRPQVLGEDNDAQCGEPLLLLHFRPQNLFLVVLVRVEGRVKARILINCFVVRQTLRVVLLSVMLLPVYYRGTCVSVM